MTVSRRRAFLIGALYVACSILPDLYDALGEAGHVNWPRVYVKMTLSAALTLRGFLDGTISRMQDSSSNMSPAAPDLTVAAPAATPPNA